MYFYYAPLLSTKKFKHKLLLYFHLLRFRYDPKSRNCHYGFVGSMVINLLNQWPVAHKIFCIQSVFVEQTFIFGYFLVYFTFAFDREVVDSNPDAGY